MKNLLTILLVIMIHFESKTCLSQTREELIDNIRSKVEDIHLDTALKTVTLQNEEFLENMTDGGGELTGFYKKGKIYRVYQSIGISYGVGITEYYYSSKGSLIFVREKFDAYVHDSLSLDYSKTTNTFNGVYYFSKDSLIHSSSTGHNKFEEDNIDPAKYYLEESKRNIDLIRKKMTAIKN